jgi:hypothetical protein
VDKGLITTHREFLLSGGILSLIGAVLGSDYKNEHFSGGEKKRTFE